MGPGTHVVDRVLRRVKPTSHNDTLALRHDLDYLDRNKEPIISDLRAIMKSDASLQGAAMKIGLGLRSAFDFLEHLHPLGTRFSHINGRTDKLPISDSTLFNALNRVVDEEGWELNF